DQAEARARALKGVGEHAAMIRGKIEIIHGTGNVEIGVGVEPVYEAQALIAEIALHLEVGVEAEGDLVAVLQVPAELSVQRVVREISDMRRHAGDRESFARARALLKIPALAPVGISHDSLPPHFMEG